MHCKTEEISKYIDTVWYKDSHLRADKYEYRIEEWENDAGMKMMLAA